MVDLHRLAFVLFMDKQTLPTVTNKMGKKTLARLTTN